jgi:glycolate oxidase
MLHKMNIRRYGALVKFSAPDAPISVKKRIESRIFLLNLTQMMGLIERLQPLLGPGAVLHSPAELLVYECDGYTIEKNQPDVVVFPQTTEQVVSIVKLCNELEVPFLPRGAGTSLAGGVLPVGGGVVISLARMKRILEVDYRNRHACVEPGVVNLWLTNHLKPRGWHFAPDPSSQGACTIGGNVATNSGGPHTLKYGVTVNHVISTEVVLPDGQVVITGGLVEDVPGYDLTGIVVGSEGTFGVVTKVWVRITRNPEAYRTLLGVFETVDDATNTISDIIGAGIIPAALEMLDAPILKAIEAAFHFGFPLDAGAVLIMEVDGLEAGLDADAERIEHIATRNKAREVRRANTDAERALLWKSRKQAFGAVGRLAPSYCTQDGVVPRTRLPHMLREIRRIGDKYNIQICNVFHAGDGNLHPILLFDERDADQVKRVLSASHEILDECIRQGGSVTGEHGIGVEKLDFMPKLFTPEDLAMMVRLRQAFNSLGLCSPHKMLPTAGACIEQSKVGRRAAL